ncbi:MAG: DNA topoisomerase VI subunit B, partial [Thermoprotei archaeon]
QYVPRAFGQLLFSSKYVLRQTRGTFGLGAKMAVLYGQITTGKPVEVVSSTINSNRIYIFRILIDVKTNKPIILHQESVRKNNGWHGTIVKVTIEGDWSRAKSRIYEYIRRTAIIAPYAEILFKDPEGNYLIFKRSITMLPKPPRETKYHPHGIDLEVLKSLIQETKATTLLEFLKTEFSGVGEATAKAFLKFANLPPDKNPKQLTRQEIEYLARMLREFKFKNPKGIHLSPLGKEIIIAGLKSILRPEFVTAISRKPSAYQGHAFIVEVGIAYGGAIPYSESPILFRFANKIPLLYDEKSDVSWKVLTERINWSAYEISFPAPLAVLVHICSTKIPYKGAGKESIAEVPQIESEIELAVREAARELRSYIIRKRKEEELARKAVNIAKYIPDVARSLTKLAFDPKVGKSLIDYELLTQALLKGLNKRLKDYIIKSLDEVVVSIE